MIFFNFYDLLIVPALILAFWAQYKVKSTFKKYAEVPTRRGMSGAEVAARILRDADIELVNDPESHDATGKAVCAIEPVEGELTDHYDPRNRTLRLSEGVYNGRNIAALGVAAHEVGHAVQHARSYAPLHLRSLMYPVSSFGSGLAFPLFFIGFLGNFQILMSLAIFLFTFAVIFTVVTLPVEFNASSRALKALSNGGYMDEEEIAGARKVLNAAAMTYVASTLMAVMQLLRLVLIAQEE